MIDDYPVQRVDVQQNAVGQEPALLFERRGGKAPKWWNTAECRKRDCVTLGAANASLARWRCRTTPTFLTVTAVLYLPAVLLVLLGHGPSIGAATITVMLATFLTVVAAAVLRGSNSRRRLGAVFYAGFAAMAVANVAVPQGPFANVGPITLTIMVLVFFGSTAGRIATSVSAVIFLAAPAVRDLPPVARFFALETPERGANLISSAQLVSVAALLVTVVVLERSQTFLLCALAEQSRARAELVRADFERTLARGEMEIELRERRRLEREVADLGDRERRQLGNELHDGVCQQITAALLRCQALERRVYRGGTPTQAELNALSSLLSQTVDETHNLARGLWPLDPEPEALQSALENLSRTIEEIAPLTCEFVKRGDVQVPDPHVAQHLYRIAQEALSNAVRHAKARRLSLELAGNDDELLMVVQDDGAGLPAQKQTGMGLRTMAYRARLLDAEFRVVSKPGGGTRIACRVPRASNPTSNRAATEEADHAARFTDQRGDHRRPSGGA